MYDLIVVGGGPAGLTAAVYAIRKRLNVLLVSKDLGGKTNYRLALPWIQDYQVIRGLEIVSKFKSELEYLQFARHMEPVESVKRHEGDGDPYFTVHTRGGGELQTKAVIIATGAKQQRLNVPGEKEFIMRGLCYSALSYAPLFLDKVTLVIGDSELAVRSAAELATVSKHVTLVRASSDPLDSPLYAKLVQSPRVSILLNHHVVEVKGDEFAKTVLVKDPDGQIKEFEVDGTFIEMGLIPNSQMVAGLVEMDETGGIQVDCKNQTSVPGIFAAGDTTTGYAEQVLVAVGEGAKAALSAYEYLLPML
jgi:alkyl hydroperoxide reductase subunit F